MRQAGKFGRRPPKNAPALRLANVLTGVMPTHPDAADYLARLSGWEMLGNDRYGDCVAVTGANVRRLVTATLGDHEAYPSLDQVYEFYKTQNPDFPSQDEGMDIQTALETLVKHGDAYFDGTKALAFAKVDHTNPDEVKAAISIFGFVWTGLNVLNANMTEFNEGRPWDYKPNSGVDGGHSVVTGGYGAAGAGALGGDERFITWAEETSFTDSFWSHQVEEAWIVIYPEHLGSRTFQEGVDQAALAEAYTALTGRPFPVEPAPQPTPEPVPTPTPIPGPPPGPVDADAALVLAQRAWEQHEDNMKAMRHCDRDLEAANRAWRQAKGL